MSGLPIYASRLRGLTLLDADGLQIGRVEDVVIRPSLRGAPHVTGLVAEVQRRRIFLNAGRLAEVDPGGVRLKASTVDLQRFSQKPAELLASDLFKRSVDGRAVMDVALAPFPDGSEPWLVTGVALGVSRALRRRTGETVDWSDVPKLWDTGVDLRQVAPLRDLHPTDLARTVTTMTPARRRLLTEALDDEELADVLEEMSEEDQMRLLEGMSVERVADVVEEMEPDDAADLLAEMPVATRDQLLAEMEGEDAATLRRLLRYDATTAGGIMTPQPVILQPSATVAEALARIRNPDFEPVEAAQVFVCEPPMTTPTGRFLGVVGFQRLLREAPAVPVGECIQSTDFVRPELPEKEVAERLAAYDLVGLAVCDEAGRLVGAITVDDVLDRTLPAGWRRRRR
ncbi:MAG: magnesium transporter [Acidimicrobiaceae bacterium]|nr:magnesium transporter [Acidimicrobiaceae bacterium]